MVQTRAVSTLVDILCWRLHTTDKNEIWR